MLDGDLPAEDRDVDEMEDLSINHFLGATTASSKGRLEETRDHHELAESLLADAVTKDANAKDAKEQNIPLSMLGEKACFDLASIYYDNGKYFKAQETLTRSLQSQTNPGLDLNPANASLLALVFYALHHQQLANTT